jgi:hypothetical protein
MVKYWLHVADYDGYDPEGEVLSFKERWRDTLSRVSQDDQIITYFTKKSEFAGLGILSEMVCALQ